MTELLHSQLTGKIIGVYYDVYNGTGRTYPEFIYERAMVMDLLRAGVACERHFNLKAWMRHNRIQIDLLANFYPDSLEFTVLRV